MVPRTKALQLLSIICCFVLLLSTVQIPVASGARGFSRVRQPLQAASPPVCGTWDGSVSDERIELTRISESAGDECRGAFTFSNETKWWADWGAYTLELEVRRTDNANAAWVTLLASAESTESTFLLPSLDRELHTFPLDRYSAAQVSVSGEMTLASITVDLALQALGTAIDLIPGGACWVPEEQLAYAAASFAYILAPAARLVWEGDLDGALEELQQLLPQFLDQCGGALREVAGDCVAEGLTTLLGKPFVIAKLAGECIIRSAKAIWDYFDYQGRPVYTTIVYEAPVAPEPAISEIQWSDPQLIGGIGQGGPTQQLLLDGDGRIWAFWEEHLQQSSAERTYNAVHYRVWEQNAWGDLQDIPGSENHGEPSAVLLPDGSILVKAEAIGESPYGWFLWNGNEWSAVPQMSLVKQSQESIRGLAADGHGFVHLLGMPVRTWDGTSWRNTDTLGYSYFHGAAVDQNGDLHVVGRGLSVGQASRIEHWSWDGGAWSASELIYEAPTEPQTGLGPPALAIDTDGILHVAWSGNHWEAVQSGTPPPSPRWISYTRGDGGQWSEPETIFGPVTVEIGFWGPAIEVASDGLVVIVWGDVKLGEGYRVYVAWGRQGNWAEPVVLSPEDGGDHHNPDIAIDRSGRVHILWSAYSSGVYHVVGSRLDLAP